MTFTVAQKKKLQTARAMVTGKKELGFTYMGLLMLIAIAGIAMAGVGITWKYTVQSAREKELLFIGNQYREAIASYYEHGPNGIKTYPKNLDALLLDKRFPTIKRHLRKNFTDPISKKQWQLVKIQDQIIGIHSASTATPYKKTQFPTAYQQFEQAKSYQDWTFTYLP